MSKHEHPVDPTIVSYMKRRYGRTTTGKRISNISTRKNRPFTVLWGYLQRYFKRYGNTPECRHPNCLREMEAKKTPDYKEGEARKIKEGDVIISRGKGYVYHEQCWKVTFQ